MRLYLDFIEGPEKGKKLGLKKTTSMGRMEADVSLNDPKLSATHAFFKFSESDGWVLIDNESRNGVWVNGIKEVRHKLKDKDVVQLGSSQILCRILAQEQQKLSERFQSWIHDLMGSVKNKKNTKMEVKPELRLKVVQGIQYGEHWDIFYGPRAVGRENLDICLYDDKAPKDSFEILVKGGYPYFYTNKTGVVKINGNSVNEKQFEPGDVISVGETKIVVEFDEGHGFST